MHRSLLAASIWLMVILACADPTSSPGADTITEDAAAARDVDVDVATLPRGAQDHLLRLNHLQMKGTHNSYHLRPDPLVAPDWDYDMPTLTEQLTVHGVRQVELDVH